MADFGILDRFFKVEREKYGKANYHFKGNKLSSKIRAFYARPFCPGYMQYFSTTMYPDTFFAEKLRGDPMRCLEIEFHENVHKWDRWSQGFWFTLKYLWPHWAGIPFILAAVLLGGVWSLIALGGLLVLLHAGLVTLAVSASLGEDGTPSRRSTTAFYVLTGIGVASLLAANIWGGGWWAFLWLGGVLFISPFPIKPVWRRDAELRGYVMSMYLTHLQSKDLGQEWWTGYINDVAERFSGPDYFFMELNLDRVKQELGHQVSRFTGDEKKFLSRWRWKDGRTIQFGSEPYYMARNFISREKLYGK